MKIGDLSISPLYTKRESVPGTGLWRDTPDWGNTIYISLNVTASLQELEIVGVKLLAPHFTIGDPVNIDLNLTPRLVDILDGSKDDFDIKDHQIAKFREVLKRYGMVDAE